MVFEGRGVLFRLKKRNLLSSAQQVEASTNLMGSIGRYDSGWDWALPGPGYYDNFIAALAAGGTALLIRHANSPARVVFAFSLKPDRWEPRV